jgi:glutaredoxin
MSDFGDRAVYFNVKADSAKMDEMLKFSKGVRKVPVIVEGQNVTIGYGGS